jgi:nucleoside-diphosphate-sugar epimerase
MRIFVTGANGFIGSHFIDHASIAGHEVIGLSRRPAAARDRFSLIQGDVCNPGSFEAALRDVDCVCHFAAAFREAGQDETHFHRVNVEGTARLMAAAHAQGVKRFVLCSTAGIYGRRVEGVIDESRPPRPWNAYERSKLEAENEVRRIAGLYAMEYVILRPTAVYGPRDQRLQKLFRSTARGRFPLFGRGDGRRHMVYVTDLADAFLRACVRPEAANQEMIIAGPEAVPLRVMLQTLATLSNRRSSGPRLPLTPMLGLAAVTEDVCRLLKIDPPLYRRRMDFYTNDAAFDCARARSILGWEPKVGLQEGLARTVRAQVQPATKLAIAQGCVWLAEFFSIGGEFAQRAGTLIG